MSTDRPSWPLNPHGLQIMCDNSFEEEFREVNMGLQVCDFWVESDKQLAQGIVSGLTLLGSRRAKISVLQSRKASKRGGRQLKIFLRLYVMLTVLPRY